MSRFRRFSPLVAVLVGAILFGAPASAKAAFVLDISSDVGASIRFPGNTTFAFPNTGAHDFTVTASAGGFGTSVGLHGDIGGTYTIGAITTTVVPFVGTVRNAPVTGTGSFSIFDGVNTLSATVDWMNITQIGTGNNLNVSGLVNLSTATYVGANTDLQLLRDGINGNTGSAVVSFSFIPAKSLVVLKNGPGPNSTSFAGQITTAAVPEPTTLVLACSAVFSFGGFSLFRRRKSAVVA